MRIPFIAGNWKMFKTVQEAVVFVKELKLAVKDIKDVAGVEIVVAPPFTAVHAVAEAARNSNIGVAAQEPVGAIGTGRTATAAQAEEARAHIRTRLRQWFGADAAERCHVIYGGSVKPDNIRELVAEPDVDGALVGGASLDVRGFGDIVNKSRQAAV